MIERPILMNAPMVRATLAGRKTQTRRIVKAQPTKSVTGAAEIRITTTTYPRHTGSWQWLNEDEPAGCNGMRCPYGQPGDRLWVRETWNRFPPWEGYFYAADDHSWGIGEADDADHIEPHDIRWRPSIHMPREASRILLEITEVRVQRLNDISQEDAIAEGAPPSHPSIDAISREYGYEDFSRSWFAQTWESINGPGSWAANPWVWAVTFKRMT